MTKHLCLYMYFIPLVLMFSCGSESDQNDGEKSFDSWSEADSISYVEKGKNISAAVFSSLFQLLSKSIASYGTDSAVAFCNIKALQVTDSLSQAFQAEIKRTSHKIRNPENKPDSIEMIYIQKYLGKQPEDPVAVDMGQKVYFFAPIWLAQPCLQCHGNPEVDIKPEVLQKIKEKYPYDQATGFEVGDLRGIWSIKFNKSIK